MGNINMASSLPFKSRIFRQRNRTLLGRWAKSGKESASNQLRLTTTDSNQVGQDQPYPPRRHEDDICKGYGRRRFRCIEHITNNKKLLQGYGSFVGLKKSKLSCEMVVRSKQLLPAL